MAVDKVLRLLGMAQASRQCLSLSATGRHERGAPGQTSERVVNV